MPKRDNDFIKKFCKNLKRLRLEAKLTQDELAYDSGMTLMAYNRLERGNVDTRLSTLSAIAKALKLKPTELLNFKR